MHFISPKITLKRGNLGWGVFVKPGLSIAYNEIIEISPYSNCYKEKWKNISENLRKIVFSHPKGSDNYVIGLGYISIYNHSDQNNADWNTIDDGIVISAVSNIAADSQIFINYGESYWSGGWPKINWQDIDNQ